ncbi:hypothetical protein EST38_g7681 [Candolleomyces aberdarensis]|uniref:Helitron helicase-like domain-containing protein n=1 Tax=Candolleomyces aberdarensis TaxID=2316362 RepID=A0A4V1Q3D3_9AGAR|nr:hypothetical protein EST38_g7681 [Candolleomyces aberdarensis]
MAPMSGILSYGLLRLRIGENGGLITIAGREEAGLENEGEVNIDQKLTLSTGTAYRAHFRQNDFSTILQGGPLFCRYMVDMYASVDQQRLMWIQRNQTRFRTARLNRLQDANMDAGEIGQRAFLPSSYIGGPWNMAQNYQNSMAIARFYGKVNIFLTMIHAQPTPSTVANHQAAFLPPGTRLIPATAQHPVTPPASLQSEAGPSGSRPNCTQPSPCRAFPFSNDHSTFNTGSIRSTGQSYQPSNCSCQPPGASTTSTTADGNSPGTSSYYCRQAASI